jgi:hypothetical protein
MADYCTTAQVKALLGATETTDDELIGTLITRASALIDSYCRRAFVEASATRYYTPGVDNVGLTLFLDDDLLSVTTLTNGDGTVITAAQYKLFPLNRSPKNRIQLLESSNYSWTYTTDAEGAISVAGSWGYCTAAARPADVTQAAARLALWLYRQREAPFSRVGNAITGEYEIPVELPDDVKAMLARYLRFVWRAV